MNKERPKGTLAVLYETSNNACYLMSVDGEERWIYDEQERLEYLEKVKNGGDYYIHYSIIKGNYPEYYFSENYILHIIPQDSLHKQILEISPFRDFSDTTMSNCPNSPFRERGSNISFFNIFLSFFNKKFVLFGKLFLSLHIEK